MPPPVAQCEIAFATDPGATPTWTDVSDYLMAFHITRGRQTELNRMEAGTAEVTLNNSDRRFDPSNAGSPYAPNVVPVRRIRLSAVYNAVTYRLFSGYIESWPPVYPGPLDSDVVISATDGFKVLNLSSVILSPAAQRSDIRIAAILDAISWPAGDRSLGTGDSTIQAAVLVNVSALEHILEVIDAENGLFFMTGDGIAKFVNRGARLVPPYTTSQGTFGDGGGSEMLYTDIAFDYSDVQLWNDVRYARIGGSEQVASDATSQARYYRRALIRTDLLNNSDTDTLAAAQWARDRFRNPALRVQRVVFDGEADPSNLYPQLFGRELGDRVTVRKTPPGGGVRIEQVGHIEQIEHDYSAEGGEFVTAWQLSPADLQLYWVLEHAVQGVLETSTVLSY